MADKFLHRSLFSGGLIPFFFGFPESCGEIRNQNNTCAVEQAIMFHGCG
jgi:hypothetical protein